jgi:hypothetical protein
MATKLPSWCSIDTKRARRDDGLAQMIRGYEREAHELHEEQRELQSTQYEFSPREYARFKRNLDSYQIALQTVRKLLHILIAAKAEPKKRTRKAA